MSDTYRRDTIWMPYGYRGHMGSVINLINNDVNTDVTPLKIVGLNNYRRLQGGATCTTFRRPWKEVLRQLAAKPQGRIAADGAGQAGGGVVQAGGEGSADSS